MDLLLIILFSIILFVLFITPSLLKRWLFTRRYKTMIEKYKEDFNKNNIVNLDNKNVYNIDDYRVRESERPDRVVDVSPTYFLVWSDAAQEYIKVYKGPSPKDEN